MSHNSHVKELERALSPGDLARRRDALRVEIRHRRLRLLNLVVELRHVDEAIRRVERPAAPGLDEIGLASHAVGEAGGISRLVVEAFADMPRALTSRDIARQIVIRLGFDTENRTVMTYMTQRVCSGLWTLKQSGAVSKTMKTRGALQLWTCGRPKT